MKRTFSLILAFAMVMSLMVIPSFASNGPAYGDTDALAAIDSYDKAKTHFGLETATDTTSFVVEGAASEGPANFTSAADNHKIIINLAKETIYWNTTGHTHTPEFVSFDGGKKWSKMKFSIGEDSTKGTDFSKFLNKESTIWLCSAYDKKNKEPQKAVSADSDAGIAEVAAAAVWKFTEIKARPKVDKFKVDYLTKAATDGGDGKWTLKKEGSQEITALEVAYSTDKKNPLVTEDETYGYGTFPGGGINVVAAEKPGAKLTFLVRVAPTTESAGSKVKKFSISTLTKAPNLKIDYKKNIIKLKANMIMSEAADSSVEGDATDGYKFADNKEATAIMDAADTGGTVSNGAFTPVPKGSPLLKDGISITLPDASAADPTHYVVRTAATEKKPASMIQLLTVVQKSKIYEKDAEPTVKGTSVKLPKGYEATLWADREKSAKDAKWKASVKADKPGVYAVRIKNTAKYNAKTNATDGNPTSGCLVLDVAVGKNEKGKDVVTAATFLNSDDNSQNGSAGKSESSATTAVYVKAADVNKTIELSSGNVLASAESLNVYAKGAVQYSISFKGSVGSAVTNIVTATSYESAAAGSQAISVFCTSAFGGDGCGAVISFAPSGSYDKFYAPTVTYTVLGYEEEED